MLWYLGAEDGLYIFDVSEEGLYQFGDKDMKRVTQLKVIPDESLVIMLAGKYIIVFAPYQCTL